MAEKETPSSATDDTHKGAAYTNEKAATPAYKTGTSNDLEAKNLFVWHEGDLKYWDKDGRVVHL